MKTNNLLNELDIMSFWDKLMTGQKMNQEEIIDVIKILKVQNSKEEFFRLKNKIKIFLFINSFTEKNEQFDIDLFSAENISTFYNLNDIYDDFFISKFYFNLKTLENIIKKNNIILKQNYIMKTFSVLIPEITLNDIESLNYISIKNNFDSSSFQYSFIKPSFHCIFSNNNNINNVNLFIPKSKYLYEKLISHSTLLEDIPRKWNHVFTSIWSYYTMYHDNNDDEIHFFENK